MQKADSFENAGKDWGQEEKGTTEDVMAEWHHQLDGHGFGWALVVGDGQGGLECCSSWGCRVGHDWATELNWTEPTPVSCLGKSMHRRVWWATVHGVPRVGFDWETHILVAWPLYSSVFSSFYTTPQIVFIISGSFLCHTPSVVGFFVVFLLSCIFPYLKFIQCL